MNKLPKYRLGPTYQNKYLTQTNQITELSANKKQIYNPQTNFGGVLETFPDGKAIFHAKYLTWSGIKNNYKNYFDKDGREIITESNSDAKEKRIWESL